MNLSVMSWIIGFANPLSALLVGPFSAGLLGPATARRVQGIGWLVLGIGQVAFLAFGYISKYPGFEFIQPMMIPVAGLNLWAWWEFRRRPPVPEEKPEVPA